MKEILVVGSVAFDTIHTSSASRDDCLGGSASYFSLAASLFAPVRVVAVVGEDFTEEHTAAFRGRRIDLAGLQVLPGRTFRWEGRYGIDMNDRTTLATELNVFEAFHPVLPELYRRSEAVFLGNIDPLLQEEVLDQLSSPWLLAMDTMNYWITHRRSELLRVLRRVQLFLLNDAEARQLTGSENILKAAEGIRMMGPSVVVIKRGEFGAIARTERGWFSLPAYPVEGLKDPTGAGDSFAGGMIGRLCQEGSLEEPALRRAIASGTAVASFSVEEFGVDGVTRATEAELRSRVRALHQMTRFDPE
ncbi:MAG: PfkB family carbohydrate kinase [Candidatus Eisenbacteria bacterium]|nr:PfkB family carbohydrate kinase [Candidatus Eisenbacteria bacterium]